MQVAGMLVGRCDKHAFEASDDLCNDCGREFCPECLVYPFGTRRAPVCVDCALTRSGVRKHARRAKIRSRRELRRERRVLRKRREEGVEEVIHMTTLDDLPLSVPLADSLGPEVRPLDETAPLVANDSQDGVDAFGTQPTSIVRPATISEPPATERPATEVDVPVADAGCRPGGDHSPREDVTVTDDTNREAFPEPTGDDSAALVPAGAPKRSYTFDASLTEVF